MNSLLELREWLNLNEAVEYLNIHLRQGVVHTNPISIFELLKLADDQLIDVYMLGNKGPYIKLEQLDLLSHIHSLAYLDLHLNESERASILSNERTENYLLLDCKWSFRDGLTAAFSEGRKWEVWWDYRPSFYPVLFPKEATTAYLPISFAPAAKVELKKLFASSIEEFVIFQPFPYDELIDLLIFKKSQLKSIIEQVRNPSLLKEESLNGNSSNQSGLCDSDGSPLMNIANEIWQQHYQHLQDGEPQPTKDYLIAWIKEKYPRLSTNQALSLYNVTRRDPPNL